MTEPPAASSRTWWVVGFVFVFAWGLCLTFFGPSGRMELPPPALEADARPGARADYGWTVRDLNEKPVSFERFRGKAVFLNVWATWCPPCVAELPSIARLAANPRLRSKGVEFVCVSTDQSADSIRRFLRDKDWPMTMLRATDLPETFSSEAIPATFLIAPDGRIAATELGAAAWDDPSAVALLESLATPREGEHAKEFKP